MPEAIEKVFGAIAGGSSALNLLEASRAPAATDDETKGFSTGSVWFKKSTGDWWTCTSAAAGAATWEELELGGGGDGVGGLIAEFYKPSVYYSDGEWVAANDESFVLTQPTEDDRPIRSGEVMQCAVGDYFDTNAAMKGILNGLDDYTLVWVGSPTSITQSLGNAAVCYATRGAPNQAGFTIQISDSFSVQVNMTCNRGGASKGFTGWQPTLVQDQIVLLAMRSPRGGTLVGNLNGTENDGATLDDTAKNSALTMEFPISSHSISVDMHALRIYNKLLTDEELATVRSWMSDNADYGTTGVTL